MSNASLRDILDLLPESCQERAILDCLQRMFSNGEWEAVDNYLDQISKVSGHLAFKGTALAIGVKCALRSKKLALALERFDSLSKLEADTDITLSIAEALLQLASQLLPDRHSYLVRLWTQILNKPLSADAQDICRLIGQILVRQCAKNGDTVTACHVQMLLCQNLTGRDYQLQI